MRRLRETSGQVSVEFVGMLALLLLITVAVWQVLLVGWTATHAADAARTGSRVEARGGDGRDAALGALAEPLREHSEIRVIGDATDVRVRVPIVMPGLTSGDVTLSRSASIPNTEPE